MSEHEEKKEWVKCIQRKKGQTMCGELTMDWMFLNLQHAENSIRTGSRLVPCPACHKEAINEKDQGN